MVILRLVLTPLLSGTLIYLACMGGYLRFGKPWLVDLYRALTVFFAALALYLLVAPIVRGGYVSVLVHNLAFWVPACVACALAAYSAFDYARRRKDYVVIGDPVEHWSRRLLGGRLWWTRLRAVRELSRVHGRDEEIVSLVEQAWRIETNPHVRDALRDVRSAEPQAASEPDEPPPPRVVVVSDDDPIDLP